MTTSIYVGRLVNPGRVAEGIRIEVRDRTIVSLETDRVRSREDLQFPSAICSPALINAHDHLKYTWPEPIGMPPYENSYEWLPTLYLEAEKQFLRALDLEDLYWLGTYKSVLSGVSTVANHCRPLRKEFFSRYPVRILHEFAREIFVRFDPRAHQMGAGARLEAELARKERIPFVVHLAEGRNGSTAGELTLLEHIGGLFEGSVLIHGLNLSADDIQKIAAVNASVVWCPSSNRFLFNRVAPISELLRANINVALGTDSTCTGSESVISEMRVAVNELATTMSREEAAEEVFSFVTVNAAKAFGLSRNLGEIKIGAYADLLIFETDHQNPYLGLLELAAADILLLTCGGKWLVGTPSMVSQLPCAAGQSTRVRIEGMEREIVGDPTGLVERVASRCRRDREFFPLGRIIEMSD